MILLMVGQSTPVTIGTDQSLIVRVARFDYFMITLEEVSCLE